MRLALTLLALALAVTAARGDNLLRNGDFQDDWSTLLPELKNHHWNYSTEVYNRRDYNPDGWRLSGKWEWRADKPRGQRKLILSSPSRMVQSVNWVAINNSAKLSGWPDAGGFPTAEAVRSKDPLKLVYDRTFRVKLKASNVPENAAKLVVAWSSSSPLDDPLGEKRVASASEFIPAGTYAAKEIRVTLPAAKWLDEAKKDPLFATQGALIPMAVVCEIVYADKQAGSVELIEATLDEVGPAGTNLLSHGDFNKVENGWPVGWSKPQKYRYFPPGLYYIFNTWQNSNSANRGKTEPDSLIQYSGKYSLRMNVPPGDEVCVVSDPVTLNQKEARLILVTAYVRTDQLAMFQIDAEDENGKRLDGFNFIHKSMPSVGTNEWRLVRQVFRPATPLKSIRVKLCARGTNGFTLDDTSQQPQQNATGLIWWDDVQVFEPEMTANELTPRGLQLGARTNLGREVYLTNLDLGERMPGPNVLTAELYTSGSEKVHSVEWSVASPTGEVATFRAGVPADGKKPAVVRLPYVIQQLGKPYTEFRGTLRLVDKAGKVIDALQIPFSVWTVPIDLQLGALYLRPNQKQFVRANLGLSYDEMQKIRELQFDVLRRGTSEVLKTFFVAATPTELDKQRAKIPDGLRGDFRNLVLTDLDVSFLPLQPFADPQRNWVIRATAIGTDGKPTWSVTSQPFCRLAHDGPQPAITSVKINEHGDFLVNDKPWMPWGVTYGHNPVYDGPADSGKYHNLANLQQWSMYDRHGGNLADRSLWDLNCLRHVEGALVKPMQLEEMWKKGLYASTVFIPPPTAKNPWPDDHLKYLKTAPNVAAVSRGPEEAFGYFYPMTAQQLDAVKGEVEYLRKTTGKPVMVGHGGYWTRLELEKVPFFDIYDPETEPWYPAPLHTDLAPLVAGKAKTIWLRPQMYESVPYERWRYHVYVELMRGARGWQIAHGPGDPSLMRGLHAELRYLQPAIYSREKPPAVKIEPGVESMTRQLGKKTIIVAATTHGMSFGNWQWANEASPHGLVRVTADPHIFRDESDGYHATGDPAAQNLVPHGIQYLIDPKKWPDGSKIVTWVKLDPKNPPKNLVAIAKADGRWTHAASWGSADFAKLRNDNASAFWFLRTFYRHARGFLGWGDKVSAQALELIPDKPGAMGDLPKAGEWVKLEVPLEKMGAADKLIDGVGFLHDGGRVWWASTVLVTPDGKETVVFGDYEDRTDPATRGKTKVFVAGLKKGTKVRVLFEDRELIADDGFFVDDFRGVDLYQRYGGERTGYGNSPVALHVYEISKP